MRAESRSSDVSHSYKRHGVSIIKKNFDNIKDF